ncbi:hypothetical protein BC833DRAFT_613642, partial [Globomyces pollinis-pini]
ELNWFALFSSKTCNYQRSILHYNYLTINYLLNGTILQVPSKLAIVFTLFNLHYSTKLYKNTILHLPITCVQFKILTSFKLDFVEQGLSDGQIALQTMLNDDIFIIIPSSSIPIQLAPSPPTMETHVKDSYQEDEIDLNLVYEIKKSALDFSLIDCENIDSDTIISLHQESEEPDLSPL